MRGVGKAETVERVRTILETVVLDVGDAVVQVDLEDAIHPRRRDDVR